MNFIKDSTNLVKTIIGLIGALLLGCLGALLGSIFFPIGTIIGFIIGFGAVSMSTDKWIHPEKYQLFNDKCPFCSSEIKWQALFEKKGGLNCSACKNRYIIKNHKAYTPEQAKSL